MFSNYYDTISYTDRVLKIKLVSFVVIQYSYMNKQNIYSKFLDSRANDVEYKQSNEFKSQ